MQTKKQRLEKRKARWRRWAEENPERAAAISRKSSMKYLNANRARLQAECKVKYEAKKKARKAKEDETE